jgi:hypothetical protein
MCGFHFRLFQYHDAGNNAGTEKQVIRQFDDTVYKIIVNKVLLYLLSCAATVHHSWKTDIAALLLPIFTLKPHLAVSAPEAGTGCWLDFAGLGISPSYISSAEPAHP